jgi:hypothetical protein
VTYIANQHGIARWKFQASFDADPWYTTIGFVAGTPTNAQDFIDGMSDAWDTNLKAVTSDQVVLVETSGLYNEGGLFLDLLHTNGDAGTATGNFPPSNCAVLIRKNTAFAGRTYRGRWYWPSVLLESHIDGGGAVDGTQLADLQDRFDNVLSFLNGVTGAGCRLLHATDDPVATEILTLSVQNKIATQRRRMR